MFVLKPLGFRKVSHSPEMQNDDLMHRGGLKGLNIAVMLMLEFDKIRPYNKSQRCT